MSLPDPGPRRARLVGTLIAALALLAIGGWWLRREGKPPLMPLDGSASVDPSRAPLADAAVVVAAEPPATREPNAPHAAAPAESPAQAESPAPAAEAPHGTKSRRPLLLHVVDRATGVELREVTVERDHSDLGLPIGSLRPSGSLEMLVATGAAPLRLEPPEQQPLVRDTLLVHAAGYEQAALDIDWTSGGERWIELRPAGGLDLDVEGASAEMQFTVHLYSIDAVAEEAERLQRRIERARPFTVERTADRWNRLQRKQRELSRFVADLAPSIPSPEVARLLRSIEPQRVALTKSFSVCRFDDLAAGRWAVALFSASEERLALPTLHAYGRFDVVAGERTALTLDSSPLRTSPAMARVAVRGRVRFDRGWLEPGMGPLPTRVSLQTLATSVTLQTPATSESDVYFLDPTTPLEDGATPDEKRFEGVALPPGPAIATFIDWPYRVRFAVPELLEGAVEPPLVELAIPPPMELTVRAVAREGDAQCIPARLRWISANHQDALVDWPSAPTFNDGRPLRARSPAGDWRLFASVVGEERWDHSFDRRVDRSGETLEIVVRAMATVVLKFREGEAIVPIDVSSGFAMASRTSGPGIAEGVVGCRRAPDESTATLVIDGEGTALLHVEEPPGYAPIAPLEVELVRGESVRVTVALERLAR